MAENASLDAAARRVALQSQADRDRAQAEADALTPEERAKRLDSALAARDAVDTSAVPKSEVHTYPDGTQVVGCPPFPPLSPKQKQEQSLERVGMPADALAPQPVPMNIPAGMPTSGEPAPVGVQGMTIEQLRYLAQKQLDQDQLVGKDPNTPNPTTDSNKPALAGIAGLNLDNAVSLGDNPTPEELAKIAADIKPTGENVTEAEADAAVTQVLRETKGPIVDDDKPAPKGKGK